MQGGKYGRSRNTQALLGKNKGPAQENSGNRRTEMYPTVLTKQAGTV